MTPRLLSWLRARVVSLREPATQTDLLQILKAVAAAVGAWLIATEVFSLTQPFLAPWAALLTVHATVYRTFWRGAQSVLATALGIALSFAVAQVLGLGPMTLAVALLLGLLLARAGVLRDEGVAVATTALFVLTTGFEQQGEAALLQRFFDTAIGVGMGLLVNLLVVPPLSDRSAQQQVDDVDRHLGQLLAQMAREMRETWTEEHSAEWIEKTRDLDSRIDHAWELVRTAHESTWWNPRPSVRRGRSDPHAYDEVLRRLEEGVAQTRNMARMVHESTRSAQEWDPRFREPWLDLLEEAGHRIEKIEPDVIDLCDRVNDLTRRLSGQDLPGLLWPTYGALISNLLHIIEIVDDVATSRPVRT